VLFISVLSVRWFVCLFVCLFVCVSVCLFVCLSVSSRDVFLSAASVYEALYGEDQELESGPLSFSSAEKNTVRVIPATFQLFYLIGWAPHHTQRKPKARGSATHSFTDIEEISTQLTDAEKAQLQTKDEQSCTNQGCSTGGCQSTNKKEQGEFVLNDK
jgi:hypothetical protein